MQVDSGQLVLRSLSQSMACQGEIDLMDEQKGKPWKGLWPLKEGKTRLSRAGPMSAMILLLEVQTQEAFLFHCPLDKELTRRIEANLEPSLMEAMMDDDFFFFFLIG